LERLKIFGSFPDNIQNMPQKRYALFMVHNSPDVNREGSFKEVSH